MSNKFTVYALVCPLSGERKYYGCTKDTKRRFAQHIDLSGKRYYSNEAKREWIKSLIESGLMPKIELIKEFDNKPDAMHHETTLIIQNRRKGIFNSRL